MCEVGPDEIKIKSKAVPVSLLEQAGSPGALACLAHRWMRPIPELDCVKEGTQSFGTYESVAARAGAGRGNRVVLGPCHPGHGTRRLRTLMDSTQINEMI